VYGLAANALDPQAVKRIFEIKGRPSYNPIIVHVVGVEMARQCTSEWPQAAEQLAKAFWPGPLTLIAHRSKNIPDVVTAGGPTVGVRWPSHPFIQAVIRECGFPLAAPSANLSNQISPTNAEHVRKQLGSKVPLIVDGGQCQVGIESTVIDISVSPHRVLRPGMIHTTALAAVVGRLGATSPRPSGALKSPGQLPKHYAPKARLVILAWENDDDLKKQVSEFNCGNLKVHVIVHTRIPSGEGFARVSIIPHDAEAFARAIYGELHQCDDEGAELIIVEALPESSEWFAIADRLKRAAVN
jgi:L-threonylcarbamoyladenylate synthase